MLIPPGFAQVNVRFTQAQGHHGESVLAYAVSDVPTQSDVNDLSTLFAAAYRAQLVGGSTYDGLHVLIGSDGDPSVIDSSSGAGVAGRSGQICPPQVQGLIRKNTALAGRRNRGRLFVPDMEETQVGGDGSVNSAAQTLLGGIANAILITGDPWTSLVLLHSDNSTPTPVTSLTVETKVATLRRRYDR